MTSLCGAASQPLFRPEREVFFMAAAIPPRPAPRQLERLHQYLERLADTSFFGKVVVSFQNGKVHDIKIEQTKKLEEL
jgi:hypothetical protein